MDGVSSFVETQIEEDLGVDHPKLETFQKAVEAILKKRLQEAEEELQFLQKENADKKKAKAKQTLQLHETQRLLKLEQRKLAKLTDETQAIAHQRMYFENANRKYETRLNDLTDIHKKERSKNDNLKEKYNRILASQIVLTTRRINMAGAVNATQTEASKAEEDFRKLQEQKKLQDLYLNKLAQDMEDLEQKALDYQSQADAMKLQSEEIMGLVRKSEEETNKVRLEKMSIMQKWTTAVINLSKRDEALESFRLALKNQELALKAVKMEIDGTKEEIIVCQEKHEHLTTLSQKAERLAHQRRNQIKRAATQIEEAKLDLNKVHESHLRTLDTLKLTESQASDLERQLNEARQQVIKLTDITREISEENLHLDREQAASDKSTTNAKKQIKILREKTRVLENQMIDTQNQMSSAMEGIMSKVAYVDQQVEDIHKLEADIGNLSKLLSQIESGLLRAQTLIDKKQSQIDVKTKERDALILAKNGAALSPLEADIEKTKNEIEATQEFCNAGKKAWLKYQNEFIELIESRANANAALTDLTRKFCIMQEKKMKLGSDIESMKQNLHELNRRIEAKNGSIVRVNKQLSEEKTNYDNSMQSIESKRAHEVNAMSDLVGQVEAIKVEVEQLAKDVETEKLLAIQAADELVQMEDQVKSSSNTKHLVSREKDNLEQLKNELHRRQVKADQIAKTTKELMESLAHTVTRRETLVNRAVATSSHRASQRPQTTRVLVARKIDDLKNKLKKLTREEKELTAVIQETESRENCLESELEVKQELLKKLHDKSHELNQNIEKFLAKKETKTVQILALQTRAKWYRAIKGKKYRMSGDNENATLSEIAQLRDQNEDMKKLLVYLHEEYPYYKKALHRALITLMAD